MEQIAASGTSVVIDLPGDLHRLSGHRLAAALVETLT